MRIDLTIVQIALIFLPGIIWATVHSRFASVGSFNQFRFLLNAFVFGIACYVVLFVAYTVSGRPFDVFQQVRSDSAIDFSDIADEIVLATVLSSVFAVIGVYAYTYKWLTRFLQFIRATRKYGDEDVWDYMSNLESVVSDYAHVRDFANKVVYCGWVDIFSETDKRRELVLKDVEVYDFDGHIMYDVPHIYIARSPDDMTVEFPARPNDDVAAG